ncbi:MAG: hypothetical protein ACJAVI_002534 [Candidatus Azotimanducaceae bacterium]|jgi:hypothetical protein
MTVFDMVTVIVIVGCATGIIKHWLSIKRVEADAGVDEQVLEEIEDLQQRVQVLEEIITDGKYRLKDEIDRL